MLSKASYSRKVSAKAVNFKHKSNKFLNLAILKKPDPAKVSGNRIRQAFLDVSMTNRVNGLASIAEKSGIKVRDLTAGDFLVFLNSGYTQMAILAAPANLHTLPTLIYVKAPGKTKINLGVLRELPKVFNGSAINYDKALEPVLKKYLWNKQVSKTGVIEA